MPSASRRPLLRRQVLAGIAGTLATVPPAQAQAPSAIRITQAVTSLSYIQSYVAREKGFFREEGLAAELVDTGGGGPDVQLVLAGRAELTVNDGAQVFPALQQGQTLRCVLSLLDRSIVNATMMKTTADRLGISPDTPLKAKLAKLKGLKIGVTRPGALTWQQARYNLVSGGLNPDRDAELIGVGGGPALAAALEYGKVDVIYISMPIGEKLVGDGKAITFLDNARGEDLDLPNFLMEALWATPDYIASNRDIVAAAVRAYRKASAFVLSATPEDVLAAVRPALGSLGDQVLLEAVRRVQPAISRTGRVTAADVEITQKLLKLNGVLTKSFSLADVFDPSFLPTAG